MNATLRRHRGFTLIELLVVISIIAMLISILLPALGSAREAARTAVCLAHMRNTGIGLASYAADNDDYFPGPNTSGTTIANLSLAEAERRASAYYADKALQNFDWVSPTLGRQLKLDDDPVVRLEQMLNEDLRCPSNTMRYGGAYYGSPRWDLPGTPSQFYAMSYAGNYGFHIRKTGVVGDEAPGGTDPDRTSGSWDGTNLVWGTEVGYDVGLYPSDFDFRLSSVKNASIKAFAVEGTRYMSNRVNPAASNQPTYNGMLAERQGGNFMHAGFLYNGGGGNPYGWGSSGTASTDGYTAEQLRDQLAPGSQLNGFRHAQASMNMCFFDGSGQTMPIQEAVKLEHHLPTGAVIGQARYSADPDDSDGDVVR